VAVAIGAIGSADRWPPTRRELRLLALSFALAVTGMLALLRADLYYVDDNYRALAYVGWEGVARPAATWLYLALSGSGILDFSPMSQVIGILATTLAAHIVATRLFWIADPVGTVAATVAIAISPYFTTIYAYRFDSVVYPIGFLLSILAIYLLMEARDRASLAVAALLIVLSYGINQPAAGAGLVILALVWLVRFVDEDRLPHAATRAAPWAVVFHAIGLVAVKLYALTMPMLDYGEAHSHVTPGRVLNNILVNSIHINATIIREWSASALGFAMLGLVAGAIIASLAWWIGRLTRGERNGSSRLALAAFPVVLLLTFFVGTIHVVSVLDDPILRPRVRTGFGPLVAGAIAIHFLLFARIKWLRRWPLMGLRAVSTATILWLAVFASVFANTLSLQTEFSKAIARQIQAAFIDLQTGDPTIRFATVVGSARQPPLASRVFRTYPTLLEMIPPYTNFEGNLPSLFFALFGAKIRTDPSCTRRRDDDALLTGEPTRRSIYYNLFVAKDCAVFVLKGKP
jgi:hypothetical protein